MHKNSSFGRNTPTYQCAVCGVRTRETGDGESQCNLCADCFYIAGEDNHHNDNGTQPDITQHAILQHHLFMIGRKGGNVQAVRDANSFAFPDIANAEGK